MSYLEYREIDGYVVAIHVEQPATVPEGYAVAESDRFQLGDEFTYYIVVNEVRDGKVTSHAAVRQAPPVQEIMARTSALEKATGAGGNPGEKGIAKRVDTLEARIAALEVEVG